MTRAFTLFLGLAVAACGDDAAPGPTATTSPDTTLVSDTTTSDVAHDVVTPAASHWIMGYYAGYEAELYPVDDIAWATMTHVAVAFYLPESDGTLAEHLFIDDVNGPLVARALIAAGHAHGVKVLASVGGAGMHDAFVGAADDGTRAHFVANIVSLVTRYGYDGVDLDWEPVEAADAADVTALVADLRAALPDAVLTMPVGFENANFPSNLSLYATLAAELDQLNIMSYGMTGAYDGWQSWHSSLLAGETPSTPTSITQSVAAYRAAGVPAAKLGLGAGFYGTCYTPPVSGPNQALGGAVIGADDGAISYTNIVSDYDSPAARRWDELAQVPYLSFATATGPAGCGFITYEDARSLGDKGAWIEAQGLGGIIIWTIAQGHVANTADPDPLLHALKASLLP